MLKWESAFLSVIDTCSYFIMNRRGLLVCIHWAELHNRKEIRMVQLLDHAHISLLSKDTGEEAADIQKEQGCYLILAWLWFSSMQFCTFNCGLQVMLVVQNLG